MWMLAAIDEHIEVCPDRIEECRQCGEPVR